LRKYVIITVFFLIGLFLVSGCLERRIAKLDRKLTKHKIYADELESSPEKPLQLCGDDDLYVFWNVLYCLNGQKFYENIDVALARQDKTFSAKSLKGEEVLKFDGGCHEKPIIIYLTKEACKESSVELPYEPKEQPSAPPYIEEGKETPIEIPPNYKPANAEEIQ